MCLVEGQDLSVCILSEADIAPESALAFRSLKWMLERKYGTDEARQRIYAVTGESSDILRQTALEEGWQRFTIPEQPAGPFRPLSPEILLPLSAAGIDIRSLLRGFSVAREELELRSFENPAWLYAAARDALYRKGKHMELLSTSEPGFAAMGCWWQQLFGESAGRGAFPVCVPYVPDLRFFDPLILSPEGRLFETMLRFDQPEQKTTIVTDLKDLGGLNRLAGKTLDQVYEATFQSILEAHTDNSVPVITIDCGPLNEHTLGQLFRFFQLSCGISAHMPKIQP
jgi:glucose-6-phosphate isomerase